MKTQAIIPAAGVGSRFHSKVLKQFVLLNGQPMIVRTLKAVSKSGRVDSIVLVASRDLIPKFIQLIKKYKISKIRAIVPGGKTRRESVYNGLQALDQDTQIVVVHDGARPLVTVKTIDESIKLCHNSAAVVTAVPVKPTIKKVNGKSKMVEQTIDRRFLYEAQTPQTFQKKTLIKAHQKALKREATDDAQLVEMIDVPVKILEGDYLNIKITTREDLKIAEALLKH